jgi:hypothetical protein
MRSSERNGEAMNDLIINAEAQLQRNRLDKEALIKESFLLWYILVEGISCPDFTEEEINRLLKRNFGAYDTCYSNDSDFNFIIGWMMNLTFWHFGSSFTEKDGNRLLIKAYQNDTRNSLFKWAIRDVLNLNENEINNLKTDISLRFEQFYNYGTVIKEYFLDIINTAH